MVIVFDIELHKKNVHRFKRIWKVISLFWWLIWTWHLSYELFQKYKFWKRNVKFLTKKVESQSTYFMEINQINIPIPLFIEYNKNCLKLDFEFKQISRIWTKTLEIYISLVCLTFSVDNVNIIKPNRNIVFGLKKT